MTTAKRKRAANPNISLGRITGELSEAAGMMTEVQGAGTESVAESTTDTENTMNTSKIENTASTEAASVQKTPVPAAASEPRPVGRPRTTVRNGPSKSNGLQPGLERFSVIVDSAQLETLRDIAWQTRRTLKDVVAEAFGMLIGNTPDADKAPRPKK